MKRQIWLVAVLAWGCGGGVSPNNITEQSFAALCSMYARCGAVSSEAACNELYKAQLGAYSTTNPYEKQLQSGKIQFDSAAAGRCIQTYANAPCSLEVLFTPSPDCRAMYSGSTQAGQSCGVYECVPGAYCTSEVDGKCPGTCTTRVVEGGTATSAAQCAAGLVLFNGVCAKPVGEGGACSTQSIFSNCASGLLCNASTKLCTKPKQVGDSCNTTDTCGSLLRCTDGKCAVLGDLNAACGVSGGCKLDYWCDTSTSSPTCKARLDAGNTCTGGSTSQCKPNLVCARPTTGSTTTSCLKPAAAGESCASIPCAGSLFCDNATKVCREQLAAGSNCAAGDVCKNGYCSTGKCVSYTATCGG